MAKQATTLQWGRQTITSKTRRTVQYTGAAPTRTTAARCAPDTPIHSAPQGAVTIYGQG